MWCYNRTEVNPYTLPSVLSPNVTLVCVTHGYGRAYNNYGTLPTSMDNVNEGVRPVYSCRPSTQSGSSITNFTLTHPTQLSLTSRSGQDVSCATEAIV